MATMIEPKYLIALTALVGISLACGTQPCTRARYPHDFPPGARQLLASLRPSEGAEFVMCTLGQYRVATVPVGNTQAIVVFQGDTPLYFSSSNGSGMFADGRSVATLLSPRETGDPRSLSYEGYDPTSGAKLLVFDRN